MSPGPRIQLPRKPEPPPRDALAKPLVTMVELGAYVRAIRAGLAIRQAELAARAGVSRQWLVALEQGRPTCEAGKVLRILETLGFEIVVTPYHPPPPWMLRASAAAQAKADAKRRARQARQTTRRNTRRARARTLAQSRNEVWGRPRVE